MAQHGCSHLMDSLMPQLLVSRYHGIFTVSYILSWMINLRVSNVAPLFYSTKYSTDNCHFISASGVTMMALFPPTSNNDFPMARSNCLLQLPTHTSRTVAEINGTRLSLSSFHLLCNSDQTRNSSGGCFL
jgi:hypothetical protein